MKGGTTAGVFLCELFFYSIWKGGYMIRVNGQEKPLDAELLLSDFLEQEGYLRARIAVELNGEIIPGSQYGKMRLKDGDVLEVVSFVGGG